RPVAAGGAALPHALAETATMPPAIRATAPLRPHRRQTFRACAINCTVCLIALSRQRTRAQLAPQLKPPPCGIAFAFYSRQEGERNIIHGILWTIVIIAVILWAIGFFLALLRPILHIAPI